MDFVIQTAISILNCWEVFHIFNNDKWLSQVRETTIDPDREIVDPHHHLWPNPEMHYDLKHLLVDTMAGHNVVQTVFMECGAAYHTDGPPQFRPVGETEYVQRRGA